MLESLLSANDQFLQHLIALSGRCVVLAEFDIYQSEGELLVAAGTVLDLQNLYRLRSQSLSQPVSVQIQVEEAFTAESLVFAVSGYMQGDSVLAELLSHCDISEEVEQACHRLAELPLLLSCLRLLQLQSARVFERGLFCAWFAAALNKRNSASTEQVVEAFIAGITHDLGYLFVDPAVLLEEYSPANSAWHQRLLHPKFSSDLLALFPTISDGACRAVLEHHEQVDGTGYPGHKVGKQLAPLGRMIHLLDSVHAIYVQHFRPRSRTLHDLVPIVQMNQMSRPGLPAADLIAFLRLGTVTQGCSVPESLMPLFISHVKDNHRYIEGFVSQAEVFLEQNQMAVANAKAFALNRLLDHVCVAMKQSGLINDAYMRWLDQVESCKLAHAYREVEDAFLMMQEVLHHIQTFKLRLQELVEEHQPPVSNLTPIWAPKKSIALIEGTASLMDANESARQSLANFLKHSPPPLPSQLHALWLSRVREPI